MSWVVDRSNRNDYGQNSSSGQKSWRNSEEADVEDSWDRPAVVPPVTGGRHQHGDYADESRRPYGESRDRNGSNRNDYGNSSSGQSWRNSRDQERTDSWDRPAGGQRVDLREERKRPYQSESYDQSSSNSGGLTLNVPSREVGKIIGRGGSKIKQLEEDSGARIKVTKNCNFSK